MYEAVPSEDFEAIRIDPSPVKVLAQKPSPLTILPPTDNISCFIKVIGVPPPNSDGTLTGDPIDTSNSDPSSFVMDVLEAENEDPFTLETLIDLIRMHCEKNIDFILARVTTGDPQDESKFYYSYYAAHHINKVLFRTQPEEGLLHRMRAKNPLNNMVILGDVHYYIITAEHARQQLMKLKIKTSANVDSREEKIRKRFGKASPTLIGYLQQQLQPKMDTKSVLSQLKKSDRRNSSRRSSFDDAFSDTVPQPKIESAKALQTTSPLNYGSLEDQQMEQRHRNVRSQAYSNDKSKMTVEEWIIQHSQQHHSYAGSISPVKSSPRKRRGSLLNPTLFFEAKYFASDDDYLMKTEIRQYFKKAALENTDAILFQLVTSNGQGQDHPALDNFTLNEQPRRTPVYCRYIFMAYCILTLVMVKFFVEPPFVVPATFILLFLFFLLFVIFF